MTDTLLPWFRNERSDNLKPACNLCEIYTWELLPCFFLPRHISFHVNSLQCGSQKSLQLSEMLEINTCFLVIFESSPSCASLFWFLLVSFGNPLPDSVLRRFIRKASVSNFQPLLGNSSLSNTTARKRLFTAIFFWLQSLVDFFFSAEHLKQSSIEQSWAIQI
jgi:hypothetical protein